MPTKKRKPDIKRAPITQGDTLLPRAECAARASVHRVTWYRWERKGLAPKARRYGPKLVGIPESEFLAWLKAAGASA